MRFLTTLCSFLFLFHSFGQTAEWANQTGGPTNMDSGTSVQTDSQGFVYEVGDFRDFVSFDPNSNAYDFTSIPFGNGYLQKFDQDGNFLWARNLNVKFPQMVIDQNDDIFISGVFNQDFDFDPGLGVDMHTVNDASGNLYLIKLDSDGNYVFGKSFGNSNMNAVEQLDIQVDRNNDIVITGEFQGTLDFNFSTMQSNPLTAIGADGFMLKVNELGEFIWVRHFEAGGPARIELASIAFDSGNNIIAVGNIRGGTTFPVDVDPGPGTVTYTSPGPNNDDTLVLKLTSNGDYIWSRKTTGYGEGDPTLASRDFATSVTVDGADNIIFSGVFRNNINFDPGTTSHILDNGIQGCNFCSGPRTAYLAKMTANGTMEWARMLAGNSSSFLGLVAMHPNGLIYWGTTYFNNINYTVNGVAQSNNGPSGTFSLFQVDSNNGSIIRIKNYGTTSRKFLNDMTFDGDILYVTGNFIGDFNVDDTFFLNAGVSPDAFTIKYNTLFLDFDMDMVEDDDDLDDDNDGILDTVEQNGDIGRDTDLDGQPDHLDLDSDGDGCFDVVEAGFTDGDGNGTLGSLPDTVDSDGLIIGEPDGYTTPADTDGNLVYDFQENSGISAGENAVFYLCENALPVDLFTQLGGTPAAGGIWSPALTSGTGTFDPLNDAAGTYTYTVTGGGCFMDSAEVNVVIEMVPNAGTDGVLETCMGNGATNLFDMLGGTPDTGGSWHPALASGSGIFDPQVDSGGTYTYTVTGSTCVSSQATVTVTVNRELSAGEDSAYLVCPGDGAFDLFDILEGTPDLGGTWSPSLQSGSGIFDPSVDAIGNYTYTIQNGICPSSTAVITLILEDQPNPGEDTNYEICANSEPVHLTEIINGIPDVGGSWSPALVSGTDIFDPAVDVSGTYTYTVQTPCFSSSSQLNITVINTQVTENYDVEIIKDGNGLNTVTISVPNPEGYQFSLDGINYQQSNIFRNLHGGTTTLYGREVDGCNTFTTEVNLVEFPNFFTPNSDNINDEWGVLGDVGEEYSIYIFDRFGKLLHQLNRDEKWDGNSNGRPMPSSDYWFKVVFESQPEMQGHFCLKR